MASVGLRRRICDAEGMNRAPDISTSQLERKLLTIQKTWCAYRAGPQEGRPVLSLTLTNREHFIGWNAGTKYVKRKWV